MRMLHLPDSDPGIRMRFPLAAPHHFPTEVSEATARKVWVERCPSEWKSRIRKFKRKLAEAS
jgi:hypothetical protein